MLILAGCTGNKPSLVAAPVSTQEYMIKAGPTAVYERIYGRMNACPTVHNVFFPADIVGGMDPGGRGGRLYIAKGGQTLWGAEFVATEEGTKLTTKIGPEAPSDRFHALLRIWAESKRQPVIGFTDC